MVGGEGRERENTREAEEEAIIARIEKKTHQVEHLLT